MHYENQIFSILIVVFLILTPVQGASAHVQSGKPKNPPKARAVLRDLETGKKTELTVITKHEKNDGLDITAYEVNIAAGLITKSSSHYDTTGSIRLTLSQFFDEHIIGDRSVSVDRYEAKWEKFDSTVTIKDAYIRPAVLGFSEDGQNFNTSYTASIGTPSLNTWYVTKPSWSGVFIIINDFTYQAASVHSKLVRGGSSWNIDFCVTQGGGEMNNCD